MRKLMKLLALALAVAMLLPAAALAAEEEEDGGPQLVMRWLDWDDSGHVYASDETLRPGESDVHELYYNQARQDFVIFFVLDGNKKTPVVPTGDDNIDVVPAEKEVIQSGAKQSSCYVRLGMKEFKDSELTATYQNKTLTFPITAQLPDVGFYSTPEAKPDTLLRDGSDPARLTDMTAYLVSIANDEEYGRHVTGVKKNAAEGSPDFWSMEEAGGGVWKMTLAEGRSWLGIAVEVSFQDVEGNAYTEPMYCNFEIDRSSQKLWYQWLEWDTNEPNGDSSADSIDAVPVIEEYHVAFFTPSEDGEEMVPLPVNQLETSEGVTVSPIDLAPGINHCAVVTATSWGKHTISYKGSSITLDAKLPEIALYSEPKISTDTFLGKLRYNPAVLNDTVYVGVSLPKEDGRTLESLKLGDFENKSQYTLEPYGDNFFKLTRKSVNVPDGDIIYTVTWKHPDGTTETREGGFWSERWPTAMVSEEAVADWSEGVTDLEALPSYDSLKDKLSTTLTLQAGESKDIYLSRMFDWADNGSWAILEWPAGYWFTSDPALKLTLKDPGSAAYTVSCDKPGTYTIYMGYNDIRDLKLFHADGSEYTDEEFIKWNEQLCYFGENSIEIVTDMETRERVPFEELYPGDRFELEYVSGIDSTYFPITVTVEAPAPAFADVKEGAWYESAVRFVSGKGYMAGSAGNFNPTGNIRGSEFAQILWNKENQPAAAADAAFQGVESQWYAPAILWAAGKGIITDTGDAAVAPTENLTRQQIALMLYNYMGKPEADADLSVFADAGQISDWAKDAVEWAVSEKILSGSGDNLNPTGTATRAQTAQILMNFFG